MFAKLNNWLLQVFADSDVNKLLFVIGGVSAILWLFLGELAPLLGAVLLAYVLDDAVERLLRRAHFSRGLAVGIVIAATIFIAALTFYALPRFLLQLRELGDKIPEIGESLAQMVRQLNEILPADAALDQGEIAQKGAEIAGAAAEYLFNNLFGYAGNLFTLLLYLVLMPLLVFFLLRDKELLVAYLGQFIPHSPIFDELWQQMHEQFGSYIRGKFLEATLVGASTWIALLLFQMEHALALAILVALSVFIPFVGAVAVTFPVVLFAYLQFGWSPTFVWVVVAYSVIQLIDAQILVPLLFAEIIKIHPVALFSSLIFFGNLWGVWGVFFAIPLASLIKCVIAAINKRRAVAGDSSAAAR